MNDDNEPRQCFCTGPQGCQPKCPCDMRRLGIYERNGRWVQPGTGERDLGPARGKSLRDLIKGATNG